MILIREEVSIWKNADEHYVQRVDAITSRSVGGEPAPRSKKDKVRIFRNLTLLDQLEKRPHWLLDAGQSAAKSGEIDRSDVKSILDQGKTIRILRFPIVSMKR
jgi:hypothetical protein